MTPITEKIAHEKWVRKIKTNRVGREAWIAKYATYLYSYRDITAFKRLQLI